MKLFSIITSLTICSILTGCGQKTPPSETKISPEVSDSLIISSVLALPEVKSRTLFIEKESRGQRHLSAWIAMAPDSVNNYYWVKVGEDNGEAFATHFNFNVYPGSMRIIFYDVVNDEEISLEEWRKIKDKASEVSAP